MYICDEKHLWVVNLIIMSLYPEQTSHETKQSTGLKKLSTGLNNQIYIHSRVFPSCYLTSKFKDRQSQRLDHAQVGGKVAMGGVAAR